MAKNEKTIDGFSVRSAKDSALVARSKANKLSSNKKKTTPKVKAVTENDPLVKKARRTTPKRVAATRRRSSA